MFIESETVKEAKQKNQVMFTHDGHRLLYLWEAPNKINKSDFMTDSGAILCVGHDQYRHLTKSVYTEQVK
jgi:hypothetical protein